MESWNHGGMVHDKSVKPFQHDDMMRTLKDR